MGEEAEEAQLTSSQGSASGWLRGDCRAKQRQGAREGPGEVASVVARVAAWREVAVVAAPASGAQRPGEGGRGKESGEKGPSRGSWHPWQQGWKLQNTCLSLLQASLEPRGQSGQKSTLEGSESPLAQKR